MLQEFRGRDGREGMLYQEKEYNLFLPFIALIISL